MTGKWNFLSVINVVLALRIVSTETNKKKIGLKEGRYRLPHLPSFLGLSIFASFWIYWTII